MAVLRRFLSLRANQKSIYLFDFANLIQINDYERILCLCKAYGYWLAGQSDKIDYI